MRFYRFILILIAAAILLDTSSVEGQDHPLLRLFSGEKTANKAKSNSSSKTKKGSLWGFSGPKRVEINLTTQKLRAYQGNRVVMKTHISSGKNRRTPTGNYRAGYKDADHYSSLYHNAPMPWSVQISGNIFMHGSGSVPNYPASHGCVRVPLTGSNPARRLFKWIDKGTPIRITY